MGVDIVRRYHLASWLDMTGRHTSVEVEGDICT